MVPRQVVLAVLLILLCSSVLSSSFLSATVIETASCTFDTFRVPSNYTLSSVQGIGDDGTVVGQVIENSTQMYAGFMRAPDGAITIYSAPKSSMTWLYGQSGTGSSAGYYIDESTSKVHGFFLSGSSFTAVNYPNATNTWLFGVNKVGAATGSYTAGSSVRGFMLAGGQYTEITYPNADGTYPMAVSDNGTVVGVYSNGNMSNGFVWSSGKISAVSSPKGRFGAALSGVNNAGVMVGNRLLPDFLAAFIYQNGVFKNIVYEGAISTTAGGINNNGVISGQIFITRNNSLGFTAVCK
jgi:hypothetical protein